MSKFEYTLPSGAIYTVEGPPGATKEQADLIFYSQVAAGTFVGYKPGQKLTSQAVTLTKFGLSRLDRGTAATDISTILAIVNGIPVLAASVPTLVNIPLTNPINDASVAKIRQDQFASNDIGPLSASQIQAMLAQIANLVDQPADTITVEKGIGKYGFSCQQLEQMGYVKPGTLLRFLAVDPEDFISVMSSPGIWTGLNGVTSLDQLLTDPSLQTSVQTSLMTDAYASLLASGAIATIPSFAATLSNGYIYAQGALQSATSLTNLVGRLGLSVNSDGVLSVTKNISQILSGNTLSNLNISSLASGAVNSLSAGLNNLTNLNIANLSASIQSSINGGVGALITNASKFGTAITTAWSNSSLGNLDLSKITNINLPTLSDLTSNLDVFGKMADFSVNFSNPLTNLGSLNLNNLNLGSLANLNLSNLNLGSLGNLGNLNLGSLANLAGLSGVSNLLGGLGGVTSVFGGGGSLVSSTQFAGGFTNTVNRSTVDSAVIRMLGNSKITPPRFEFPSAGSILSSLDIRQAQSILSGIKNPSSLLTGATSGITGGIPGINTGIGGTINRLIG
jgi:hypothetical protein